MRDSRLTTGKLRTELEMRDALSRFCNAAWNKKGSRVSIFSIPPNPERDADLILADAIDELLRLREALAEGENT